MPALSHLGLGLAAKRATPQISVIILVLAALALDILAGIFWLLSVLHIWSENVDPLPWSHSLALALPWSLMGVILAVLYYRNQRAGLVIGLLVFSHWVLDYLMWKPSASLLFPGGPEIGLNLSRTIGTAIIFELGVLIIGIVIYSRTRGRKEGQNFPPQNGNPL